MLSYRTKAGYDVITVKVLKGGEIILVYPSGPIPVTQVVKSGRPFSDSENQRNSSVRRTQPTTAGFEDGGRGPQIKECGWSLEAGKAEEVHSSLEPSL